MTRVIAEPPGGCVDVGRGALPRTCPACRGMGLGRGALRDGATLPQLAPRQGVVPVPGCAL